MELAAAVIFVFAFLGAVSILLLPPPSEPDWYEEEFRDSPRPKNNTDKEP